MTSKNKGILTLLLVVFIFSFHVIISRIAVAEVSPFYIHFLRVFLGSIFFAPFLIKKRVWEKQGFKKLLLFSPLASINWIFFMWGIQYTTASASQLIYAIMPSLTILITFFLWRWKYSIGKIIGVLIGLFGVSYIIYLSTIEKGQTITGSLTGNFLMLIAMLGWLFFTLISKKITKSFSPIEIGGVAVTMSVPLSLPLVFFIYFRDGGSFDMNIYLLLAVFYMGFFTTFFNQILYQFALHYLSTLTVTLSAYIQPVFTTILAVIFLGELVTTNFILGSILIFFSVFLCTSSQFIKKSKAIFSY